MNRPTGGREVLSPQPIPPHERPPRGTESAPAAHGPASRPILAPASPSGTPSSRARPIVEPLYPALPVIELDRRRSPRRASTKPGPFGTPVSTPVPLSVRAQHTPPPRAMPGEEIEPEMMAPSSIAPSRIASASIAPESTAPIAAATAALAPAALAPATIAPAQMTPPSPPSQQLSIHAAGPARHDATDLIPLRARSGAEPTRRRLGWGWYIALAAAAAFFLATIALSAS